MHRPFPPLDQLRAATISPSSESLLPLMETLKLCKHEEYLIPRTMRNNFILMFPVFGTETDRFLPPLNFFGVAKKSRALCISHFEKTSNKPALTLHPLSERVKSRGGGSFCFGTRVAHKSKPAGVPRKRTIRFLEPTHPPAYGCDERSHEMRGGVGVGVGQQLDFRFFPALNFLYPHPPSSLNWRLQLSYRCRRGNFFIHSIPPFFPFLDPRPRLSSIARPEKGERGRVSTSRREGVGSVGPRGFSRQAGIGIGGEEERRENNLL